MRPRARPCGECVQAAAAFRLACHRRRRRLSPPPPPPPRSLAPMPVRLPPSELRVPVGTRAYAPARISDALTPPALVLASHSARITPSPSQRCTDALPASRTDFECCSNSKLEKKKKHSRHESPSPCLVSPSFSLSTPHTQGLLPETKTSGLSTTSPPLPHHCRHHSEHAACVRFARRLRQSK